MTESDSSLRRLLIQSLESWHAAGISHLTLPSRTVPQPVSLLPSTAVQPEVPGSSPGSDVNSGARVSSGQGNTSHQLLQQEDSPEMPRQKTNSKPSPIDLQATSGKSETAVERELKFEPIAEHRTDRPLTRDQRVKSLQELCSTVAACRRCQELATTRTQTVFGIGNPEARVMFIGEAPGADEDRQGEPFVGKAGQLLNKIIEAMKLKREEIYICNILRCRPPDNRTPLPQEAANCREYLDGQIRIVAPQYIVCWGSCAAQNLLGMTDSIGKMRGRFYQYGFSKVLCTYHPSYLLRNPAAKKDVWEDMKILMKELGIPVE